MEKDTDSAAPKTREIGGISILTIVAIFFLFVALLYFAIAQRGENDSSARQDSSSSDVSYHKPKPKTATSGGAGEERMRDALVQLFGVSFPTVRLSLLANDLPGQSTGKKCEFDAYNRALKLAGERHGKQHEPIECEPSTCNCPETPLTRETRFDRDLWAKHINCEQTKRSKRNHFNMTNTKVRDLMFRDEMKEIRARENGIVLVIVWYDDRDELQTIIDQLPPELLAIANL